MMRVICMTTIDKTLPSTKLLMVLPKGTIYKEYSLPEGYSYVSWNDSMKDKWCELHLLTGVFDDKKDALASLEKIDQKQLVLVQNAEGELVGSGALMNGDEYGMKRLSLQNLSVSEDDQYQGIGKAIVSRLALQYEASPSKYPLYCAVPLGAYGAVILLSRMEFTPYLGEFKGYSEKENRDNWETETKILKEKTQMQ